MLVSQLNLSDKVAEQCLQLAQIRTEDTSFIQRILTLGVKNSLLDEGISELKYVFDSLIDLPYGTVVANLLIARGLDYYTGTVYEGKFGDYPDFPTIYAGGRYENLVGSYLSKQLPGVGISIGITRIFGKLLKENRIVLGEKSPTDVLIIQTPGSHSESLMKKAEALRERGINVEVYHESTKSAIKSDMPAVRASLMFFSLLPPHK